jgi:hypothetical protein
MRVFGVKTLLSQHTTDNRFSFVLRSSDYGLTIGTTDNWMIRIATGQGWDSRHRPQQPARRDNPAPRLTTLFSLIPSFLPASLHPSFHLSLSLSRHVPPFSSPYSTVLLHFSQCGSYHLVITHFRIGFGRRSTFQKLVHGFTANDIQ